MFRRGGEAGGAAAQGADGGATDTMPVSSSSPAAASPAAATVTIGLPAKLPPTPADSADSALFSSSSPPLDGGGSGGAPQAAARASYFRLYVDDPGRTWLDALLLLLAVVGSVANGAMLPLFSIVFGDMLDVLGGYYPRCGAGPHPPAAVLRLLGMTATADSFTATIASVALQFVYIAAAAAFAGFLQQFCWTYGGGRRANRARRRFLRGALRQDVAFYDTAATSGALLQGLNDDAIDVDKGVSDKVGVFLQHMSTFACGYVIAFVRGWDMTLVMLACLPFLGLAGAALATAVTRLQALQTAAYTAAGEVAAEAISQVRTVAAYGGERRAVAQYREALLPARAASARIHAVGGACIGAMQAVMFWSYAAALTYGAWRVSTGAYTGGRVMTVLFAALLGSFSLGLAAPIVSNFAKAGAAGERVRAVASRRPAIDSDDPSGLQPDEEGVRGEIELRAVVFAYPSRPDAPVLRGFSLRVAAGTTVALVGASGSGKSTVVQLIERFYDPASGEVLFDGRDLRALNLRWLRARVGLMEQGALLFATSIRENVHMGRRAATDAEVEAALRASNAWAFVKLLPKGLDTQVGERGVLLSGGQKQRLALARVLLKSPRVLLLDEATSALDTRSEKVVQRALDSASKGRTTVVVAHRLSTVRNADSIAVVREGTVVERGTHAELLRDPAGAYTHLVRLQMQGAGAGGAGGGGASARDEAAAAADGGAEGGDGRSEASDGDGDGDELVTLARAPSPAEDGAGAAGGLLPGIAARWRRSLEAHSGAPEALVAAASAPAPLSPKAGANAYGRAALAAVGAEPGDEYDPSGHQQQQHQQQQQQQPHRLSRRHTGGTDGKKEHHQREGAAATATKDKGDAAADDADEGKSKKAAPPPARVPMSRLARLNAPEWPYAAVGAVASVVVGAVQPVFALVLASMISVFFDGPDLSASPELKRAVEAAAAAAPGGGAGAGAGPLAAAAQTLAPLRKDTIMAKASTYSLYFFAIGLVILSFLAVQQVCFGKCGAELAQRVRLLLLAAILRQEVAWFDRDEASAGRLASHLASDATHVRGAVADVVGVVMQNLGTLGLGYGLALYFDWRVALLVTAALPLLASSSLLHVKFTLGTSSSTERHFADANGAVAEAVAAARTIQSFNLQREVAEQYDSRVAAAERQVLRAALVGGAAMAFSFAMLFGIYAVVLAFGGWEIRSCLVDFNGFFKAFMCILISVMGLAQAAMGFPDLSKAGDAIRRVFPVVDRRSAADATRGDVGLVPGLPPPPPPQAPLTGHAADAQALAELAPDLSASSAAARKAMAGLLLPGAGAGAGAAGPSSAASATAAAAQASALDAAAAAMADAAAGPWRGDGVRAAGALSFRDVCFAYPTRPSAHVLRGFSAEVAAGRTLALVGESGGGKSTVVALLERFYEPSSGAILLDGVELRDLNLRWLRAQMSLVQQEPLLLSGTIRSNILYGRPGAGEADVVAAAKAANAWEFIASLPRGLDTPVGERGSQLSGGQKQRVAIARALVKDPRVLLLDEATAALDAQSEHLVQRALDGAAQGRTTVVIAHRLSTIRRAHAIAVVNRGCVGECGTHEELIAKVGGAYYRLCQAGDKQTRVAAGSGSEAKAV